MLWWLYGRGGRVHYHLTTVWIIGGPRCTMTSKCRKGSRKVIQKVIQMITSTSVNIFKPPYQTGSVVYIQPVIDSGNPLWYCAPYSLFSDFEQPLGSLSLHILIHKRRPKSALWCSKFKTLLEENTRCATDI